MRQRTETIANLKSSYTDLENLLGDLRPEEWDVQSLCPDWTVRGVVTHLAAVELVLRDWVPTAENGTPPFNKVGEFTERVATMPNEDFIAEVRSILARRRDNLDAMTAEEFARDSMTPVGPGTYHRFMDIRVFDFWVHQRDMTTPLGRSTDDGGPAAETAVDEVDMSIGYIVGRKIGLADGKSIAIHLTGPVERTIMAAVEGRAARVEELTDPSVEVRVDSLTFVQLACGRIDPQGPIDDGRISWSGDAEWGEKAARNLTFTM